MLGRSATSIKARVELYTALLTSAAEKMMHEKDLRAAICNHLVLLHQITRASVPLMEAAHRHILASPPDPVSSIFGPYLLQHIEEESNHDVWTLDDLESVGIDRATVLAAPPPRIVAALVGAQYYWIFHYHPVALLGYMLMLESNAPSEAFVDEMTARTGLPEQAFNTHRIHATLDPGHQADLYHLLDRLPLTDDHVQLIANSVSHTGLLLAETHAQPEHWADFYRNRRGAANNGEPAFVN